MINNDSEFECKANKIIEKIRKNKNVILYGPGGTGKSYMINYLTGQLTDLCICVTAMTGIASVNLLTLLTPLNLTQENEIRISTFHNWAGIGMYKHDDTVNDLYSRIEHNKDSRLRWLSTQLLFIDEMSMMSPVLFEKMHEVAKK